MCERSVLVSRVLFEYVFRKHKTRYCKKPNSKKIYVAQLRTRPKRGSTSRVRVCPSSFFCLHFMHSSSFLEYLTYSRNVRCVNDLCLSLVFYSNSCFENTRLGTANPNSRKCVLQLRPKRPYESVPPLFLSSKMRPALAMSLEPAAASLGDAACCQPLHFLSETATETEQENAHSDRGEPE